MLKQATICLGLITLPQLASADLGCQALLDIFRAPLPAAEVQAYSDPEQKCSKTALGMLQINQNALNEAQPAMDPTKLYGTWLGDDVLSYVMGVTVPGQEVLVISPGSRPYTLTVQQYWMKAVAPYHQEPLWDTEGSYQGQIAKVELYQSSDEIWRVEEFENPPVFGARQIEHERHHDLWIKSQLNHFELGPKLLMAEDTLVLSGERFVPLTRKTQTYDMTYTRVANGAPEMALAMAAAFEFSQTQTFECLTHHISDGRAPFLAALGGLDIQGLDVVLREMIGNVSRRETLDKKLRAIESESERDALMSEMKSLIQFSMQVYQRPDVQALTEQLSSQIDVLCPRFF